MKNRNRKSHLLRLVMGGIVIISCAGCQGKGNNSAITTKNETTVTQELTITQEVMVTHEPEVTEELADVTKEYESFIGQLEGEQSYQVVEIGANYPVLLVAYGTYEDSELNCTCAMGADVYYYIDGKVELLDGITSGGTAYAIRTDGQGLYVCANHGGSYYILDEESRCLKVKESVYVFFDEEGNGTYSHEVDGQEVDSEEASFTTFYDQYDKATAIDFYKFEN